MPTLKELAALLRRTLSRQHKEGIMGWEPINTAPKDGTRILFWDGINPPSICWWDTSSQGSGWISDSCIDFGGFEHPTHWMLVPTAPSI